jgi:hypothetical protein
MASPMVSPALLLYQTRAGPMGSMTGPLALWPTTICLHPTCPPASWIRRFSSCLSGLWSLESGIAVKVSPWPVRRPSTARESPQLPMVTWLPLMTHVTHVAPEHLASTGQLMRSDCIMALLRFALYSVLIRYLGRLSWHLADTRWPNCEGAQS